jgi:hypothetical protein
MDRQGGRANTGIEDLFLPEKRKRGVAKKNQ